VTYELQRRTLNRGDIVVFYTDGLSEAALAATAICDTRETEALSAIVCDVATGGNERMASRIFAALESGPASSLFSDDATAFTLRIR
jgi:serine phosphatase RsbU (regulator of sigma subunit)